MDYTQLNKPEVIYELRLRNIPFIPTQTANELKDLLVASLDVIRYPLLNESPYDFQTDIDEIKKCLLLISATILSYPLRKSKIFPYIFHVKNRLSLLEITTDLTNEQITNYRSLFEELLSLESRYNNIEHPPISTYHSTESITQTSIPQPLLESLTQSLSHLSSNRSNLEIKKFNYSGDGCPREFISRVEEFALCRNINFSLLSNHIYDILSGVALDWYRSNKQALLNWNSFKDAFQEYFKITDYDYKIKKLLIHVNKNIMNV